ncbi:ABC transporter substrate-binding protein [Herbidospora galbida]|uniref:ABC transporter substrate-binding protein n=1 Tax=Herbidospora galbida TaxID=2575442 RepID=A0A4U3LN96_9ACTN|nr:ABC transporter substrate-binding protein [Herbidospora galbida]TKK77102.1 ABC transporter substrate-binding protein [Herbidospora galbida]
MQLDAVMATRPRRSVLPALLLGGPAAGAIVAGYAERLVDRRLGRRKVSLVPHALLTDDVADAPEPHVRIVLDLADGLDETMPQGSGALRLPLLRTCEAVLGTPAAGGDLPARRRALRDRLYEELTLRRPWLGHAQQVASHTGQGFSLAYAAQAVLQVFVVVFPRWVYGLWLSRRSLHWAGELLKGHDRRFLHAALELTEGGRLRANTALVQELLVTALSRDLDRAARPSRFWVYRARRRWSFVVLLGTVGGADSPCKVLLDTWDRAVSKGARAPLLVLGALTAEPPSVAAALTAADVAELYHRPGRRVYALPLADEDDDGAARQWFETNLRVHPRPAAPTDYVRATAPVAALLLVAAAVPVYVWGPDGCRAVEGGEVIGVTDGAECSLAPPGPEGDQLRELERLAAAHNAAVDLSEPHRTTVYFAPVTVRDGSGNTTLNGVQSLRGVLVALAEVNASPGVNHMRQRILIANPGDAFAHGTEVARMILERAARDRVAAVVGITQSRPAALEAVTTLSDGKIPVIGSSVTGSAMVEGPGAPTRYVQVSPSNGQVSAVTTEFVRSRKATTMVLVAHPDDEVFSVDLAAKVTARFTAARTVRVDYSEFGQDHTADDAARRICAQATRAGAFVVYAGRSARLMELLNAMRGRADCTRADGARFGFLAEAMPSGYLDDPAKLTTGYPFAEFSHVSFSPGVGRPRPHHFVKGFPAYFTSRGLPAYVPNSDAAGAYDAVMVAAKATDGAFADEAPDEDFPANAVYKWLMEPGVRDMNGATGGITLNSEHRYPVHRTLYVLGPHPFEYEVHP